MGVIFDTSFLIEAKDGKEYVIDGVMNPANQRNMVHNEISSAVSEQYVELPVPVFSIG
jgi:hypothetical protein